MHLGSTDVLGHVLLHRGVATGETGAAETWGGAVGMKAFLVENWPELLVVVGFGLSWAAIAVPWL